MKSAVMIAYRFPPDGHAGTYRPLRFVRHLSRMGWQLGVVSCLPPSYERYDPKLLSLVPAEVDVKRVSFRDPWQAFQAKRNSKTRETLRNGVAEAESQGSHQASYRSILRKAVSRIEACCYHPDMAMPWIRPSVAAAVEACARLQASVIWATAGPVASFSVAEQVSQRTNIPYVLDFRDAWTITHNEFEALRPKWVRDRDRRNMYRLLANAQAVIFTYESVAQCFWTAYRGALKKDRIHLIPNGFEGPIEEFTVPTHSDRCEILYAGTLSSYDYEPFLISIQRFKELDASLSTKLHVRFVGEGMDNVARRAATLGLADIVETSEAVTHSEVVNLQKQAHALLIFGRPKEMKGHELFAGAKLFGYLKSGKPILGVLPHDETKRILEYVGVSTIASVDSIAEILAALKQLLSAYCSHRLFSLVPNRSACLVFSAERQAQDLLPALEGRPPAKLFAPGTAKIPPSLRADIPEGGWTGFERSR
jgi:hypothetical protein